MPNTNCLEGMRCPNPACGQEDTFKIDTNATVTWTDNGAGNLEDPGWLDGAWIMCPACGWDGITNDFKVKERVPLEVGSLIKLYDGMRDMVEGGRITLGDIPDDYGWLVLTLDECTAAEKGKC